MLYFGKYEDDRHLLSAETEEVPEPAGQELR